MDSFTAAVAAQNALTNAEIRLEDACKGLDDKAIRAAKKDVSMAEKAFERACAKTAPAEIKAAAEAVFAAVSAIETYKASLIAARGALHLAVSFKHIAKQKCLDAVKLHEDAVRIHGRSADKTVGYLCIISEYARPAKCSVSEYLEIWRAACSEF